MSPRIGGPQAPGKPSMTTHPWRCSGVRHFAQNTQPQGGADGVSRQAGSRRKLSTSSQNRTGCSQWGEWPHRSYNSSRPPGRARASSSCS